MELIFIIGAMVVVYVLYVFAKASSAPTSKRTESVAHVTVGYEEQEERDYPLKPDVWDANKDWLKARWEKAEQVRESGESSSVFPPWWYGEVTERQLERLRRMRITAKPKTKGQASDLIGLGEEPSDYEQQVLKFFSVPMRDMNQTRARGEVARLMSDEENVAKWRNRSATTEQRECIKFFGEKVPKGLKHEEAAKLIAHLEEKYPAKAEEWDNLQCIVMEFNDKDARELMEVKKPSAKVLRECIDLLRAEGHSMEHLADNTEIVAEKLIEMHPEVQRPSD